MSLQKEFETAIFAAGNTRSTFNSYWPHVENFIRHTRQKRGAQVDRTQIRMADVYAWRDHMAGTLHESPATCNQGVSAIKFLFEKVIGQKWEDNPLNPIRLKQAQRSRRRVISKPDLLKFFEKLNTRDRLIAHLMYAGVMRLSDVIRTRVKDFNFNDELIELAETKHSHFRMVPFPKSLHESVRRQIESVKVVHKFDEFDNPNGVPVGYQFAKKSPSSPRDFRWYWLFPSDTISRDPDDNRLKRFHLDKGNIRRRFAAAIRAAGITRRMTPHDLRRVAATHLHLDGMPLTKLQGILGHNSIEQTRDYIMDGESNLNGSDSPFDKLMASG